MSVLAGKRILVVEDEFVVAAMAQDMLTDLGAAVVGPAMTLSSGLSLAQTEAIDAALLDVNINGQRVDPIVETLSARGIPVVLATGYGTGALPGVSAASALEKPYTQDKLGNALARALSARERG